ncbi:acyl-CoA dehydrogenase family protein [Sphingobium sp. AN558]|uniref:acyl-CoA dehydrogenase family protein n=1 Tax=Sphingobium sp. AN558 TaxID=3133442 RepID=UPI0030BEE13F
MSEILAEQSTIDPEEMRDAARRLLADRVNRRAPYAEPPRDESETLFAAMSEQGWALLTAPEETGGLGQSFAALAPIYEEMGKVMSPVALFPSLASLELLTLESASPAARALAEKVACGDAQVAVAIVRPDTLSVEGECLNGMLLALPADIGSDHLLLLVDGAEAAAWLIEFSAPGVLITRPEMWDRSRPVIDIKLEDVDAIRALSEEISAAIERVRGHLELALTWDSLGGARQSLDETVAYMMSRQQFGRPIGSFQALKHRAADHKLSIDVATALAREATDAFAKGAQDAAVRASQARLLADESYHAMAEDAVQLHGGIGFTWEHDCHLFLKRALLNEMLYDSPEARRDRLAPTLFKRMRR